MWMRKTRARFLVLGQFYNTIYTLIASTLLWNKFIKKIDITNPNDPAKMLIDFGMIFVVVMGLPSYLMNIQSFMKELQMQVFSVGKMNEHLWPSDITGVFYDLFFWWNPIDWFRDIF
jgi:hypothetical protein